jgi:hypothetical protein
LECNQHSFRGRISATQTIFQIPTSAIDPQLIDWQSYFKLLPEWAESTAAEKAGRQREISSRRHQSKVHSCLGETAEFLGFSRTIGRQRESRPKRLGGGSGIRTHGALARTTVFETAPFDRSGIPPRGLSMTYVAG